MAFHDRLLRAKERWAFAEGYCATITLKLRAFHDVLRYPYTRPCEILQIVD